MALVSVVVATASSLPLATAWAEVDVAQLRTVVRLLKTLVATGTIGMLLTSAVLAPPDAIPGLRQARLRRAALILGIGWCVLSLAELLALAAAVSPSALVPAAVMLATETAAGAALAVQAAAALVAAAAGTMPGRAGPALGLAAATAALAAVAGGGHFASHGHSDLGPVAVFAHVAAATAWAGGLLGILTTVPGATRPGGILARFGRLATGCAITVGASGLVLALMAVDPTRLFGSGYGVLLVLKTFAFAVLVAVARAARRAIAARGSDADAPSRWTGRSGAWVTALVETAVMAATFALAVALSQTAPAPPEAVPLTADPLSDPPTALTMLGTLAPSGVGLAVAAALAVPYIRGVRALRRRGDAWPAGRVVSFLGGVALLLAVTCTGVGAYANVLFSMHMLQHMTLNMIVPVLLVLGAPITLALRALPMDGRQRLLRMLRARPSRVLAHPAVVAAVFVGSLYLLYFTPLFPALMSHPWGHAVMLLHFLASGFLFFWMVLGVDPDPHRPAGPARIPLIVVGVLGHTLFAVVLVFGTNVIGADWFDAIRPEWQVSRLDDQRLGGAIAWALGEFAMVGVLVFVIARWFQAAERADRARARVRRGASAEEHRG
ncbi:cytochrome c oxidase assembly protein [Microbacterium album]|uniref:Copper resistance protein D domain-containing protein n=1 Tax=Microbacterium album TaxID=2053191 RepID=A0A917IFB8_9MICO|nr:cytochrome c oxidase assembly protein [Microbacterium album]GGH47947.1 hypothetical protein GCM10010921_25060 [Microbacterium album]